VLGSLVHRLQGPANFTVQMLPTGHGLLVNRTGLLADDDTSHGLAPELVPKIASWLHAI
jgi:hypothetical protein